MKTLLVLGLISAAMFASCVWMLWPSAGALLNAHERDICYMQPGCDKGL